MKKTQNSTMDLMAMRVMLNKILQRKKPLLCSLIYLSPLLFGQIAKADFVATGKFTGLECSGFIIEACSNISVDAVGKNGTLYNLKRVWPNVSEYNASQNICHINIKRGSVFGFWGDMVGKAAGPDFYTLTESKNYRKVDIESLSFKCTKK